MSGRWCVRRETTFYFDPDGNNALGLRWCVYSPSGLYWGNYETHAEALANADRQSRTRQVVLPRGPYEIRSKQNIYEELIKVESITHFLGHETVAVKYTTHGVPDSLFLASDELRPLALALLALAETEEHE